MKLPATVAIALCLSATVPAQQIVLIEDVRALARGAKIPSLENDTWLRGDAFGFGAEDTPRLTMLLPVANVETLRNRAGYLQDLQRRYAERGLRAVCVLRRKPADADLERVGTGVSLVVSEELSAQLRAGSGVEPAALVDRDGVLIWSGPVDGGIATWIERGLTDEEITEATWQQSLWRLEHLGEVEDHQDRALQAMADTVLSHNERNPDGWSLQLLCAAERELDLDKARKVAAQACKVLALDSAPLCRFVDQMLCSVPDDRGLLQEALMALVPVAPMAEDDLRLQLTYLKVLNGLGRKREAERLVERLAMVIEERPAMEAAFAEAMAFGSQPQLFADQAKAAIERAVRRDPRDRTARFIQYLVLERCCDDALGAMEVLAPLLRNPEGTRNNDAWYLMTIPPRRGRFHRIALRYCEHMVANETLSYTEEDTVALAYYLNGRVEEALELQEKAAKEANDPAYSGRVERYRKALEQKRGR